MGAAEASERSKHSMQRLSMTVLRIQQMFASSAVPSLAT
jgi:hypothetical protein